MTKFIVNFIEDSNDLVSYVFVFESVFICVHLWLILAVPARLGQIVINHPSSILLRFGDRSVAAFFVAADFVFSIKTFQSKFARSYCLIGVAAIEVERNQCRVDQFRN